jgi:hypothetical protein
MSLLASKETPLHDLVRTLELRPAQVCYWAGVTQREAALWIATFRPMSSTSTIALFWCLFSLYYRIRKIQTQGTADMTTTVWGMVQKAGLGPKWFTHIEHKIRAIEDIIPRCKDYLERTYKPLDFVAAAEFAVQRGLINEATRDQYVGAIAPQVTPS